MVNTGSMPVLEIYILVFILFYFQQVVTGVRSGAGVRPRGGGGSGGSAARRRSSPRPPPLYPAGRGEEIGGAPGTGPAPPLRGAALPVAVRFLHPASRGRALAGGFGGQLLAGRLAAGGLAGRLLGAGHAPADVAALHLPEGRGAGTGERGAGRLRARPAGNCPPPRRPATGGCPPRPGPRRPAQGVPARERGTAGRAVSPGPAAA